MRRVAPSVSASWRPTCAISDDRQERRHGQDGQQRQDRRIDRAVRNAGTRRRRRRETAQAGENLEQAVLQGELAEERQCAGRYAGRTA